MPYTDDPVRDFEQDDLEKAKRLAKLPHCSYCREPIQSENYHNIFGYLLCSGCLEDHFTETNCDYEF